jgi:hypothetical protein
MVLTESTLNGLHVNQVIVNEQDGNVLGHVVGQRHFCLVGFHKR